MPDATRTPVDTCSACGRPHADHPLPECGGGLSDHRAKCRCGHPRIAHAGDTDDDRCDAAGCRCLRFRRAIAG